MLLYRPNQRLCVSLGTVLPSQESGSLGICVRHNILAPSRCSFVYYREKGINPTSSRLFPALALSKCHLRRQQGAASSCPCYPMYPG